MSMPLCEFVEPASRHACQCKPIRPTGVVRLLVMCLGVKTNKRLSERNLIMVGTTLVLLA
jgi:hypothetical protein